MTSRDLPRKLRHETVAFFCDAWLAQAGAAKSHRSSHEQDVAGRINVARRAG